MNIKPTPELIEQLATQCGFSVSEHSIFANSEMTPTHAMCTKAVYALAELAAAWGAEQERAGWLEANAPSGWIDDLRKQAQQTTADAGRVLEWMRTPDRKPANLAFTDGPERQAAYWIEIAQQRVAQQTTEPELPEAVAYRQWNGDEGYWYYGDASCAEKNDELLYTAAQMHDHYAAGVRAGKATGKQRLQVPTGWAAPKDQYAVPVLFNPYTGEPRDVRDVQSDPQGILIVPPGKVHQLAAMQGGQQP